MKPHVLALAAAVVVLLGLGCAGGDDAAGTTTEPGGATTAEQTTPAVPPTQTETGSPPPELPPDVEALAGGMRAAAGLAAEVRCTQTNPRRAIATLRWTPAEEAGSEQRVLVTNAPDGFAKGEFEAGPPLPPDRAGLEWERVNGDAVHYWRVVTRHEDGWAASPTADFEGEICEADYQSP